MKRFTVQILVVVAIIQMKPLKTDVEKGSMSTAIVHGLVDPKEQEKSALARYTWCGFGRANHIVFRKAIRLIFLNQEVDTKWQHKQNQGQYGESPQEFSFLVNKHNAVEADCLEKQYLAWQRW